MEKLILNNQHALKFRRQYLRTHSTNAEIKLWHKLKQNQLGYKFRRQHSFGPYILDFYCPQKKLGIEIDGDIHLSQKEQDEYRTRTLQQYGISIIRFTNKDITNNIEGIITKIEEFLNSPPSKGGG